MSYGETTSAREEGVAAEVVDAAVHVHMALGPGLLESAYEACLEQELLKRGLAVRRQIKLPLKYGEITVNEGFRLDLLVEDLIIVEIKAVQDINPVFAQQVMTHLRLMNLQLGFLMNFNVPLMKDGIKRIIRTRT